MDNKKQFFEGLKDGIPIALGYFAVSFSLGINAGNAGFNAFQGFLTSFLVKASAGEYAGYTVVASDSPYIEMILVTLVANARYFLMSCSLGQNISPQTSFRQRLLLGFCITDEVFAISIARPKYLNPFYTFGAIAVSSICWASGTSCGIVIGNIMPKMIVSALSIALYGMFLAVIVPTCKKDKTLYGVVLSSFILSYAFSVIPCLKGISEGIKTIILTVLISSAAALIFPIKDEEATK